MVRASFGASDIGRYLVLFLIVALLVGGGLLYLWPRLYVVRTGYELDTLYKEREEALSRNRTLRVEVASLRSLDRIEALARRMGFKDPAPGQLVYVMVDGANDNPSRGRIR